MELARRQSADGHLWVEATDPRAHFPFVALLHVLYARLQAREVVWFTLLADEAFAVVELPNGLQVRLSHVRERGTTLRPERPEDETRFPELVDLLERTELPTRWTPMHPSVLDLGHQLPR